MRIYLAFILLMASVGLLDSIALYRAAAHLKADPIYLGIISFIWSLIYIISSIFFGYLGDRYRVRVLGVLSASLLIISTLYILFSQDLLSLSIGYAIHSAATASGRIAVSIDVLENSDRDAWSGINLLLRGVFWVFRAALIYITIGAGYSPGVVIVIAILASTMLTMIQDPLIPSRRFLYRLGDTLDRYYSISLLRGLIISSLLDAGSRGIYNRLNRIWSARMPSPALLAISSALLTASAEMILTPAPSILSSSLGSRGLSQYLVLSPMLVGVLMIIGWIAIGITALWSLWLVLATAPIIAVILNIVDLYSTAIIYILAIYMLSYNMLEIGIFNSYSNTTSGYNMGGYQAIREVGGLVGGIFSGYVATYLGYLASLSIGLSLVILSAIIRYTA